MSEGAKEIGTHWIETDKNERIWTKQQGSTDNIPMHLKSRLVVLGTEGTRDVLSDSPTANLEGVHLVFSFASSRS